MERLIARIASRQAVLAVVGLGTVGLTVASALADAGFRVVGVDKDGGLVEQINAGAFPWRGVEPELPELLARVTRSRHLVAGTSFAPLANADVVLLAVDTPLTPDRRPDLGSLRAACDDLGRLLLTGALVVVESTVAPGTCTNVVGPILEQASGKKLGVGFFLGHCPERLMPGRLLQNLRELPRACGGASPETSAAMCALYGTIVRGRLDRCDCVTAELVKTAENTYRDVNIAFANELSSICEAVGADFRRVRELVNGSPGRDVLWAGAGVGGACIPKDPWLLAHAAGSERGAVPKLIAAAREVNDAMPLHVATLAKDALAEKGVALRGSKIAVFGYAYLENSADTRGSPSQALIEHLRGLGAEITVHDPWAATDSEGGSGPRCERDPYAAARGANAVLLMVAHDAYRSLDLPRLARAMATAVLVDGRFLVEADDARQAGFVFRGLGRGA
jgi:UDP-N-acetyl-D-mannosaminuronic acid dehydrogenase